LGSVTSHLDDGLAVITLADGDAGNRLDRPTLERLHRHLKERIEEPDSRVLLLRSRGERFCLGMDLGQINPEEGTGDEAAAAVRLYSDCLAAIALSPKPVAVLVEGEVRGGGMGLVAAGDVTIASRAADFEFSEVLFGLIPANVLPFLLIQRLSPRTAGRLILTARRLTAEEALAVGLVDEVFSPEELEKGARGVIGRFFRASPRALAEAKRFLREILYRDMEDACARANRELLDLASSAEVRDVARAFLSGGLPEWSRRFRPGLPLCGKEAEQSK
jgi:enoyl-CoA hydratase/carnithine racemase